MIRNKVKTKIQEGFEHLRKESKEVVRRNFTELRRDLIEQVTGSRPKETQENKEQKGPQNFTPLGEKQREVMEKNFKDQEKPELDEIRKNLAEHNPKAALKEQFNYLRSEERRAREELEKLKQERLAEVQREEQEKQSAARRQYVPVEEPSSKVKRGGLFAKKKKPAKTMENRIGQGKQ